MACGYRFRISVDNLGAAHAGEHDTGPFIRGVVSQARAWQQSRLPPRAELFFDALSREFGTGLTPGELELDLAGLA